MERMTEKRSVTLLQLFIPSVDRYGIEVPELAEWVDKALAMLGTCFGGGTAFPKAKGVWRDDEREGELVFDEPVIMQCYTSLDAIEEHQATLGEFLYEMGVQMRQGAVAYVIDQEFIEIGIPLEGEADA
jgi:hypothetical protein